MGSDKKSSFGDSRFERRHRTTHPFAGEGCTILIDVIAVLMCARFDHRKVRRERGDDSTKPSPRSGGTFRGPGGLPGDALGDPRATILSNFSQHFGPKVGSMFIYHRLVVLIVNVLVLFPAPPLFCLLLSLFMLSFRTHSPCHPLVGSIRVSLGRCRCSA